MKQKQELMVSIRCVTYNHKAYIRKCLEGFVMQKTDFKFEAIVYDDASTDGTAAIIREYAEKYPDIIKPIFETENQYSKNDGSIGRIMNAHMEGKYIALCNGDDYWIDPLKLQKQVDYMEEHSECSLIHTGFQCYYHSSNNFEIDNDQIARNEFLDNHFPILIPFILDSNDYLIQTCTAMYRSECYEMIKSDLKQINGRFLIEDTQLWCFLNKCGDIHYIKDVTSVYRICERYVNWQSKITQRLLFDLSCAEMRVYMADALKLSEEYKIKFRRGYVRSLLRYKSFNRSYAPQIELSHSETNKLSLYPKRLCKAYYQLCALVKKLPTFIFSVTKSLFLSIPIRFIRTSYLRMFIGKMGKNVYIGKKVIIMNPSMIFINDNVAINNGVLLDGRRGLYIGSNVDIASEASIWTLHHDYNDDYHTTIGGSVVIEDYCWICYRSIILPSITIARGSVVATSAVVTKDTLPMSVVAGIPAKKIADRKSKLLYQLKYSPKFYEL